MCVSLSLLSSPDNLPLNHLHYLTNDSAASCVRASVHLPFTLLLLLLLSPPPSFRWPLPGLSLHINGTPVSASSSFSPPLVSSHPPLLLHPSHLLSRQARVSHPSPPSPPPPSLGCPPAPGAAVLLCSQLLLPSSGSHDTCGTAVVEKGVK